MKVTVIDCSVSGHRETYYKQFAHTWAGMGYETSLIAPDGKHIQDTVAFQPISAHPLLPLPAGKPLQKKLVVLRNAMIRLQNLYRLRRSLKRQHPDLVFFACLDDMLPTLAPLWLLNLLLPYQWSGLLVQSALPPYQPGMPDTRPFLRSKNCVGTGILNEYSAKDLKAFQGNILLFPDFADLSAPATTYPLLQELKEKTQGRKVVSLLGSINFRKGIKLLLESIPLLPEEDYFFLIAGKSSLTAQQENDLRTFEKSRSNCLFSLEKIPDESCFNALIAESDLIFAAYKQFTGSSNLLTKAAAFRKPVIVSRGFCMGQRVEQYGTGQTTGEDNAGECSAAIRSLCSEAKTPLHAFDRYAHEHTVEKLITCFNQISKHIQ